MKKNNNKSNIDLAKVKELEDELQQLRSLVNTLLTVITEEADGVQNGSAPTIPGQAKRGFSM
ncbi:MAG: hypothetical protein CMA03_03160 [Euryarchaeota archaeon]|nr:hypothetical protein [Euryarchaeota archaeon]|tara:strand:+ start:494 stop:679 length:186 start_codon:yes stop_codon:yes gene_type:complete